MAEGLIFNWKQVCTMYLSTWVFFIPPFAIVCISLQK